MAYGYNGNLAYRLDAYPDYAPQPARPNVRTIRSAEHAAAPSLLPLIAKMAAVFIVVVAALSFVRIMLTSEAVTTMIESDTLSSQISEARSAGISLEMEQSVLSNPSAIKAQATKLGMVAPKDMSAMALTPDVVAIDNSDTLSLSGTIKKVVEIQE